MEADETSRLRPRTRRRTRDMGFRVFGICLAVEVVAFGCSDGVGRPLRAERAALSGAGGGFSVGAGGSSLGAEAGAPSTGGVDVPLSSHCVPADGWVDEYAEFEESLLSLLNTARAFGASCERGDEDQGPRVPVLTMQKELRCSARLHVRDMVENGFFSRFNLDMQTSAERMRIAGAEFEDSSEIIVASGLLLSKDQAPVSALLEILSEEEKCEDALDDRFVNVGIGYYEDLWAVDLSGP